MLGQVAPANISVPRARTHSASVWAGRMRLIKRESSEWRATGRTSTWGRRRRLLFFRRSCECRY